MAAGLIAFVGFGLDYLSGRDTGNKSTDSAAGVSAPQAVPGPQAAALAPGAIRTLASGTDYTASTLAEELLQPMTAPDRGGSSTMQKQSDEGGPLARLTGSQALTDCLTAIERENAGGTIGVESVDYARYDGAPALVVRFTASNGRWAWAAGPACGTPESGAATITKVPVG